MKNIILKSVFLLFLIISFYKSAFASDFPLEIKSNFSNPKILGKYSLKLYFLDIYDITTYTKKSLDNSNYREIFAINIKYLRNFSKEKLIESSIEEMQRINNIGAKKTKKYRNYLQKIFVDVKKNDQKTVLIYENGLKIFYNHNLIGEVEDREFGLYFADIWLSKNAKYQKMRNSLLGL